jgi:hypothetical protein
MRVLFGIILGIVLTLGGAYYHDANLAAPPTAPDALEPAPALTERPIVNWDVLGAITRAQVDFVKGLWNKAVGKQV